jgi:hypothetical protein
MPRKKKSKIDVLVGIIEDSELTTTDLQWILRIVSGKLKRRQVYAKSEIYIPGEEKDAGSKRPSEAASRSGLGKASSGKKD